MPDSATTPAVRLSPRQRECLQFVYERRTSKEIAALTGLSVKTVDSYVAEATAALGARNRRHAAELLRQAEGGPEILLPGKARVASEPPQPQLIATPERRGGWSDLLPFRRQGSLGNDLHPLVRVLWIVQLAAFLAIAFGMLAVGGEVLGRMFGALK